MKHRGLGRGWPLLSGRERVTSAHDSTPNRPRATNRAVHINGGMPPRCRSGTTSSAAPAELCEHVFVSALRFPCLREGDLVRLVSPASYPAQEWVDQSIRIMTSWGLKVDLG